MGGSALRASDHRELEPNTACEWKREDGKEMMVGDAPKENLIANNHSCHLLSTNYMPGIPEHFTYLFYLH